MMRNELEDLTCACKLTENFQQFNLALGAKLKQETREG